MPALCVNEQGEVKRCCWLLLALCTLVATAWGNIPRARMLTVGGNSAGTLITPGNDGTSAFTHTNSRSVFVPSSAAFTFTCDNNRNLLGDDRWTYNWEKGNQLVSMLSRRGVKPFRWKITPAYK